jgi:site-specific DNA-methyltransferase (adenine-specific)
MFSSKEEKWQTPQYIYDELDKEFNFTLDPCSQHDSAKCEKHYTPEEDGLVQSWRGETVFVNPPYTKPEEACKTKCKKKRCAERGYHITKRLPGQVDWIRKSYEESRKPNTTVVMLIPARTDTEMFHEYIYHKADEIRFVKGRISFVDPNTKKSGDAAPFPSMIVVFRGNS